MHAALATPRALRRASSSPDLSSGFCDTFGTSPRQMLKRASTSPDVSYKRQRVGSLAAAAPGTHVSVRTGSRPPRGRSSFFALAHDHYSMAQLYSPTTPALSPSVGTPSLASADGASLASLSPLSDFPLDDVFGVAPDLFVAGLAVCAADRVCARIADAPSALPAFALDQSPHAPRGPLAPVIPLLLAQSQSPCPTVLAHVGLSIGSDAIASISSLVTVSSKQELQLRCSTNIYCGGVLMASHEDPALPFARNYHLSHYEYSVPLAPDFLSRLLTRPNHERHGTTLNDTISLDTTPSPSYEDTLVLLRFQSQTDLGQKNLLVLACQFSLVQGDQGFVKLWRPVLFPLPLAASPLEQPALLPSPTIVSPSTFAPLFSVESLIEDLPLLAPLPKRLKRPNLTVAIPPAEGYLAAAAAAAAAPASGGILRAVSSPMPITPLNQLIHAPADPPPLNRDADERKTVRGERFWAPTPTEAAFPASMSAFYFDRSTPAPAHPAAAPRTPRDHLFPRAMNTPTFPSSGALVRLPPVALASPYKFGFDDLAAKTFDFGGARRAAEL